MPRKSADTESATESTPETVSLHLGGPARSFTLIRPGVSETTYEVAGGYVEVATDDPNLAGLRRQETPVRAGTQSTPETPADPQE